LILGSASRKNVKEKKKLRKEIFTYFSLLQIKTDVFSLSYTFPFSGARKKNMNQKKKII